MKNYRSLILTFLFFTFPLFVINSNAQTRTAEYLQTSVGNSVKDAGSFPLEKLIFSLINKKRAEFSLPPLIWSEPAAQAARLHSRNMSLFKFFSHTGLDGKDVDDRIELFGLKKWRMDEFIGASEESTQQKLERNRCRNYGDPQRNILFYASFR